MSDDNSEDDRNPLFIPRGKPSPRLTCCPKCKSKDFGGRNIQGSILWTCVACKNQWHGGLQQEPSDPTIPMPPMDPRDKPIIEFVRNKFGEVVEQRRGVNPTQEYRKGLPVPQGED